MTYRWFRYVRWLDVDAYRASGWTTCPLETVPSHDAYSTLMEWSGLGEPPEMTTEDILEERAGTHGSFKDNARISQAIKALFVAQPGWHSLTPVQREALDMVALKASRILSGHANEADHWFDISGYAQLAAKEASGRLS